MTEDYVSDGDLGSGEPGSLQWHKCHILQLPDDEKVAYIMDVFQDMSEEDKLELMVFAFLTREKLNDDA